MDDFQKELEDSGTTFNNYIFTLFHVYCRSERDSDIATVLFLVGYV